MTPNLKKTNLNILPKLFFLLIATIISFTASAQSLTKTITLQQAIDLSIQNSHQLKISYAQNEKSILQLQEAMDNRLPNASVSGSYLRLFQPNIDLKTKGLGGGNDSSGNKNKIPSANQIMYGMVNISLPIFAGGRIRYGIESAKYLQQAAQLDAENNKEGVILNTINAFINLYKASATVKVMKENLLQSNQRDSVFSRLEQNGLLARNDLLKAQLQTSNIELSLLDAENNYKIANINMNLMIGYDEQTILNPDPNVFEQKITPLTIGEYEQYALQNRKDIQSLDFKKKAANSSISVIKSEMYPSISLTGGYMAGYIPKIISITNAINFGIGIQYNLSSLWKTKTKIKIAKTQEKEIIENQMILNDAIKLQINKDFENYLLSQKKIIVYEKAVIQAEENYRITKNKYDNNLVNTTELLDANLLLLQSKINLAVSKADVLLAYSQLLKTSGQLSTQIQ